MNRCFGKAVSTVIDFTKGRGIYHAFIIRKMTSVQQKSGFSFADYDAIGFDLDHTLVKYNLHNLFNLIYEDVIKYLVYEKGYRKETWQPYETGKDFVQKGIVFDKERGNFLKLSSDYTIIEATHGTTAMTKDEIKQIYGNECIWDKSLELPEGLCHPDSQKKPYYVFRDYFVLPIALICAKLIDSVGEGHENMPTVYKPSIWQDVFDSIIEIYRRDNFGTKATGFFAEVVANPEKYLIPCSQKFLSWLWEIKQKKKVFLLTSAHVDVASFNAQVALGKDWRKYFDVCVSYARKPSFFTVRRPFLTLNGSKEGDMISGDDLKVQEIYSQGNWLELQSFIGKLVQKSKPNVLYIGDSVIEDIFAPSKYTTCKTVAVVEELRSEGVSKSADINDASELTSKFWGSFFASNVCDDVGHEVRVNTLWNEVIMHHSKLAIPDLESLSYLSLDTEIKPLFKSEDFAFYPAPPSQC